MKIKRLRVREYLVPPGWLPASLAGGAVALVIAFVVFPAKVQAQEPVERTGILSKLRLKPGLFGENRRPAEGAQERISPGPVISGFQRPALQERETEGLKDLLEVEGLADGFGESTEDLPEPSEQKPGHSSDLRGQQEGGEMGFNPGIKGGYNPSIGQSPAQAVGPGGGYARPGISWSKAPLAEGYTDGSQNRLTNADIRAFAKELDAIDREINEWGHASMSGLVLFPMSNRFHINNQRDITTYITETKAHSAGAASLSREVGVVAAAAAGINTQEPGVRTGDVPSEVIGPGNFTVNIESHDITPTATTEVNTVTQNPATSGHAGFQTTVTLSPEQVDTIAASAFVNKEVMNLFSFPAGASDQYVMFFGLAQVNVSPGWRTQKDYYCEVQMHPFYAVQEGSRYYPSYEVGHFEQPMVFSAFPLLKAQVLDLKHHEERQADMILSFAGAAAAAGNKQSAKFLLNYHKQLQQDVKTRTALPLLVPSSDGTQLTYRFDPGLQALGDPSSIRSKPENVLNATSVPTLFVVVCEREELARWTHINIRVNTRFAPLDRRHFLVQTFYDMPRFTFIKGIDRSNQQRLRTARSYSNLADFINALYENNYEQTPLVEEMQNRFLNLRTLAGGVNTFMELPAPESFIAITSVHPSSLPQASVVGSQLYIEGQFGPPGRDAPTVLVGGRAIPVHTYGKNGILLHPFPGDLPVGTHSVVVTSQAGLHVSPGGLAVTN